MSKPKPNVISKPAVYYKFTGSGLVKKKGSVQLVDGWQVIRFWPDTKTPQLRNYPSRVYKEPGRPYYSAMWLEEEDDNKAKEVFIEYFNNEIEALQSTINDYNKYKECLS